MLTMIPSFNSILASECQACFGSVFEHDGCFMQYWGFQWVQWSLVRSETCIHPHKNSDVNVREYKRCVKLTSYNLLKPLGLTKNRL